MKVVESLLRKACGETLNYWKDICCWYTSMRQLQCVPTTYVTENKETSFKFTLKPSIMSIVFASFKHRKVYNNTCHYTTKCLYLDDSYIDFMNDLFANLGVA